MTSVPTDEQRQYIYYGTNCTGIESKLSDCGSRKLINQCSQRARVQCSNSSGIKVFRKYISLSYN